MGRSRTKKLSTYLIKRYVLFTTLLAFAITLFYPLTGRMFVNNSAFLDHLDAKKVIQPDFEQSDIGFLKQLKGWVEVLDEENSVIYTKGTVLESKKSYTQEELLEQGNLMQLVDRDKRYFLMISVAPVNDTKKFAATYSSFQGIDGKQYTGIVKVPVKSLRADITFVTDISTGIPNELGEIVLKGMAFVLLCSIFLLMLFAVLYGRTVRIHVGMPNKKLVAGLTKMTSGHLDTRLVLQAEHEFEEIEFAFNMMAEKMQHSEEQRRQYEKEKQQLFSNIAHDLRTPLTTMRGYTRAIQEGLVTGREKLDEYLTVLDRKTKHLQELVELLLSYTRLDSPDYPFKMEKTDFPEFIRETVIDYLDEVERADMELIPHIPDGELWVIMDRTEMRRVIVNLLSNAIRHNPEGTKIGLTLWEEREMVTVEVRDNGKLIPEDVKNSMFQPFSSGGRYRTAKEGSGLGLSICKKIMEKHGGRIEYEKMEKGWKCFRVVLPLRGL